MPITPLETQVYGMYLLIRCTLYQAGGSWGYRPGSGFRVSEVFAGDVCMRLCSVVDLMQRIDYRPLL